MLEVMSVFQRGALVILAVAFVVLFILTLRFIVSVVVG